MVGGTAAARVAMALEGALCDELFKTPEKYKSKARFEKYWIISPFISERRSSRVHVGSRAFSQIRIVTTASHVSCAPSTIVSGRCYSTLKTAKIRRSALSWRRARWILKPSSTTAKRLDSVPCAFIVAIAV